MNFTRRIRIGVGRVRVHVYLDRIFVLNILLLKVNLRLVSEEPKVASPTFLFCIFRSFVLVTDWDAFYSITSYTQWPLSWIYEFVVISWACSERFLNFLVDWVFWVLACFYVLHNGCGTWFKQWWVHGRVVISLIFVFQPQYKLASRTWRIVVWFFLLFQHFKVSNWWHLFQTSRRRVSIFADNGAAKLRLFTLFGCIHVFGCTLLYEEGLSSRSKFHKYIGLLVANIDLYQLFVTIENIGSSKSDVKRCHLNRAIRLPNSYDIYHSAQPRWVYVENLGEIVLH